MSAGSSLGHKRAAVSPELLNLLVNYEIYENYEKHALLV